MYPWLTGSASWYLLTLLTEVFGVKGDLGDLVLEPKLVAAQFDSQGDASIRTRFAERDLEIVYHNPRRPRLRRLHDARRCQRRSADNAR